MQAHDDKLSPQCLFELHQVSRQLQTMAELMKNASLACKDDISKLCANIQPGEGRLAECLVSHQASVSKNCADTLQHLQAAADEAGSGQQ